MFRATVLRLQFCSDDYTSCLLEAVGAYIKCSVIGAIWQVRNYAQALSLSGSTWKRRRRCVTEPNFKPCLRYLLQSVFGQSQMQGLNVNSEMKIPSVQGILNHSILMMMTKVCQRVHIEIAVSVAKKRLPFVSPKSDILGSLEHS